MLEYQAVVVSPDRFAKLAVASKVEFQWTSTECVLPDEALTAIRNLTSAAVGSPFAP